MWPNSKWDLLSYLVPIIKGTAKVVKQDIPGENQLIVHRFAVIKCLIWQPCHSSAQIPPRSPTLLRETRLSTQWTRKSDLAESQDQITWLHRWMPQVLHWQSSAGWSGLRLRLVSNTDLVVTIVYLPCCAWQNCQFDCVKYCSSCHSQLKPFCMILPSLSTRCFCLWHFAQLSPGCHNSHWLSLSLYDHLHHSGRTLLAHQKGCRPTCQCVFNQFSIKSTC